MAVFPYEIDQPLFAEFSVVIFWFGDAVAIGEKNIAFAEWGNIFFVFNLTEEANYRSSAIQPANCAVLSEDDRGQVASIGISQRMFAAVVKTEEHGRVLFRGSAFEELVVKQG